MRNDEIEKREHKRQLARRSDEGSAAATAWKIVGGMALALAAAAFMFSLPDLKRYIKISMM